MKQKKHIILLHVDGLSVTKLQEALRRGYLKHLAQLMKDEGYEIQRYRPGLPSSTPSAQAGILYGDNANIPSFRWWDDEAGLLVESGIWGTFKKVSHKYFRKKKALTANGAAIASLYPGDAAHTFALAYKTPHKRALTRNTKKVNVLWRFFRNPLHILEWIFSTIFVLCVYFWKWLTVRWHAEPISYTFFISNAIQEIFLAYMTRFAILTAMQEKQPIIYAGFYTYDEAAHAFGPSNIFSLQTLWQMDQTIKNILQRRHEYGMDYEIVLLSDHGQIETIPFKEEMGKSFGAFIAEWVPSYEIQEFPGKRFPPKHEHQDGQILITYTGGLGQIYFKTKPGKLTKNEIDRLFPTLITKIISLSTIDFVLVREKKDDIIITKTATYVLGKKMDKKTATFLKRFDDPTIVLKQLQRLNSYERSGELIFFGKFFGDKQINFESQVGGHGAMGGEQMEAFLLVKKEWKITTQHIYSAHQVYDQLQKIIQHETTTN